MDINALLSPSDSSPKTDSTPPTPTAKSPRRPRPVGGKRTSSGLSHELIRSPDSLASNPSPLVNTTNNSPSAPLLSLPPLHAVGTAPTSLAQGPSSAANNPSSVPEDRPRDAQVQHLRRPGVEHRPSSTPQMETLADLASMQYAQTTRTYSADSVRHQSASNSTRQSMSAQPPGPPQQPPYHRANPRKSVADLTMAEAPASTPEPRSLESSAMSDPETKEITDLLNHLAENSYDYTSHVQLIQLLHRHFHTHISSIQNDNGQMARDPASFPLLSEMRQARDAMDSRFAIGESLLVDWIQDESLLATSGEHRVRVTELCQKAVQDEPASVRLWVMYSDWIQSNYLACHGLEGADLSGWTEEDRELCRELFTAEMKSEVFEQAVAATQWLVDQSHVVWQQYAGQLLKNFPSAPTQRELEQLRDVFLRRLQVPNVAIDETKQMLWQVVSKYEGDNWEDIMQAANSMADVANKQMKLRWAHEAAIREAMDNGDRDAEFNAFSQYLQWERKQKTKNRWESAYELQFALFERALLRFPTYVEWWLDYIDFAIGAEASPSALPLIDRATRHCPWSGDLWCRHILRSDVEGKPREEIEAAKHRATNSGLLDVGGMEEMLKVLQQWCSYLRRYAFRRAGAEDDLDVAELGITAAIDDIQQAGGKIYGRDFKGDPFYRIEKIYLKFLVQTRRLQEAREVYRKLVPLQRDSYDFWSTYYYWELWLWGYDRMAEPLRVETTTNGPELATAVLQEAIAQRNVDMPEKLLETYLNHFQQHESGENLQSALIDAREFSKHLAVRRAKEAQEAAEMAARQKAEEPQPLTSLESDMGAGEKRKRDDEVTTNGHADKKARMDEENPAVEQHGEPSSSASAQIKRDREHNTITVKDLPLDATELEIKKFFREVGAPLSINVISDASSGTATATVEFESHEDVLAAKTKNGKELKGSVIRIQSGTQSTLYVANYPPEYDEGAIRKLFNEHGDIVSVRFPSLKYNNRRRFCYVQFLTADMAKAAESALDGKILDGQHTLLAKISDPEAKKQRSGAQAEGRELYVKNIERSASDDEVRQFFGQYGTVVSINAIKLVSGKRTGTAFVVFSSTDEANSALKADSKPFRDRILHVELASSKGRPAPVDRARKEDVIIKQHTSSASPEASADLVDGRHGSHASTPSLAREAQASDESWKTAKERKIAIFNLPDTVNDARVRAAMETYGALVKIQMRRQDHGAIVEFANVNDAFNVRQGVACADLGPDVKTGDVGDLLAKARRWQGDPESATASAAPAMSMRPVSRPVQRGGRRGGLGFKRAAPSRAESGQSAEGHRAEAEGPAATKKSNSDFRSMLDRSRTDRSEKKSPVDDDAGDAA